LRIIGCSSTKSSSQLTACLGDLARHFKTDPTETVSFCFGIPENTASSRRLILLACSYAREDSLSLTCLRELARNFKTDPTDTVALCFLYPKTPCLQAEEKLSSRADEQARLDEVVINLSGQHWVNTGYSILL
jgi:hypothetical protein